MDAIDIFFVFYGALLALAAAKVLSSAARLIRHRATVRIGWATPLLLLLLLFDLSSMITGAWRILGVADPNIRLVAACLGAAGAYYLAATLAVPETLAEDEDLHAHYRTTKHFTVGGVLVANLLGAEVVQLMLRGPSEAIAARWTGFPGVMSLVFYGLLITLLLIRNRATNIVMLATLNVIFVLVLLIF
jgi:hypothetical protein